MSKACEIIRPVFDDYRVLGRKLLKIMEAESLPGLYFAAPPEEVDFINSIRDFFKTRNKLVATGKDVEKILKIRNCGFLNEHFQDTVSMVEQEICFQSEIFYRSLKSTWSSNIRDERRVHNIDNTRIITDLLNLQI